VLFSPPGSGGSTPKGGESPSTCRGDGMIIGMATETKELPVADVDEQAFLAPRYHVILLDDDDHSYEYVMEMLIEVFAFTPTKAFQIAEEVDNAGRAIVFTGPFEIAELKQEQIHARGADWRIEGCAGSMTAVLEPAPA